MNQVYQFEDEYVKARTLQQAGKTDQAVEKYAALREVVASSSIDQKYKHMFFGNITMMTAIALIEKKEYRLAVDGLHMAGTWFEKIPDYRIGSLNPSVVLGGFIAKVMHCVGAEKQDIEVIYNGESIELHPKKRGWFSW